MDWWVLLLIIILIIIVLVLVASYISFKITFYSKPRKSEELLKYTLPVGKPFEPYYDIMLEWMKELRSKEFEPIEVKSFDNLTLRGKFYKGDSNKPLEIMFHGYRGTAERDFCGGVRHSFDTNHNILLVDQRASGYSDGNVITFGINERHDVLSWINYVIERFGENTQIILTGISMGASTVLMSLGENLPKNVICIVADCGYSSPKEVIKKTIKEMHLPKFMYGFVKAGGFIFGRFNIDETTPLKAIQNSNIPVIIFHGLNDSIVPSYMSNDIYNALKGMKKLVQIENCDHGISYLVNHDLYIKELDDFLNNI